MKYYIITAISKLTGEREPCSIPMAKSTAMELVLKHLSDTAEDSDYYDYNVEPYKDTQLYLSL